MASKSDLKTWIVEILQESDGPVEVVEVTKGVWALHEAELRESGDLFYTWQYDLRWAAQKLRNEGVLAPKHGQRTGGWQLAEGRRER